MRWQRRAKSCPHISHRNGFNPLCTRSCRFRLPRSAKLRPQPLTLHTNGRSPVWVRTCRLSAEGLRKDLVHEVKGQWWTGSLLGLELAAASLSESLSSSDVDDGGATASLRFREAADEEDADDVAEVVEVGADEDTAR